MQSRRTFLSPPAPCEYLPDREWQLEYDVVLRMDAAEYMERLRGGWRRFGYALFRPACGACRMCRSLRVPVATFRADRSQRRAWKTNAGAITLTIGVPSVSRAKRELYKRFHEHQHYAKGWPAPDQDGPDAFVDNPFPTEEWCYTIDDRLIGVGYVDVLPEGLSAIYFYSDPDERHRSLGTFNVLSLIAAAAQRGLAHVYLGYYVEGCSSLEYKGRFRPNEVRDADGAWTAFLASSPGRIGA